MIRHGDIGSPHTGTGAIPRISAMIPNSCSGRKTGLWLCVKAPHHMSALPWGTSGGFITCVCRFFLLISLISLPSSLCSRFSWLKVPRAKQSDQALTEGKVSSSEKAPVFHDIDSDNFYYSLATNHSLHRLAIDSQLTFSFAA